MTGKGYWIKNVGTGTVLDLAGGRMENGNAIHGWSKVEPTFGGSLLSRVTGGLSKGGDWENQTWHFPMTRSGHPGMVNIELFIGTKSIVVDLAAGHSTNGTPVLAWESHDGDNQKWYMEDAGDGKKRFKNAASGTYLDLESGANGAKVRGWQFENTDRQLWRLEERT
ncbi:ricin B lectin domain-containing protein, partial [Coprinopsis sp. MPI-PUGE-AT-0042]